MQLDEVMWGDSLNATLLGAGRVKIEAAVCTAPPIPSLPHCTFIYPAPFLFRAGWARNQGDQCEICGRTTNSCDITRHKKRVNSPYITLCLNICWCIYVAQKLKVNCLTSLHQAVSQCSPSLKARTPRKRSVTVASDLWLRRSGGLVVISKTVSSLSNSTQSRALVMGNNWLLEKIDK